MKITFIANACCIYESQGKSLLTDPWLTDGAFEGSWFHYPKLKTKAEDLFNVDYVYISHLHPDHYDPEVLKNFPKNISFIYLDHGQNFLKKILEQAGFTQLIGIKENETKQLGPFSVTLFSPFAKHLFHDQVLENMIDSAMAVSADGFTVLNTNDNRPSKEAAGELKARFGKLSVLQLNYNAAGPFPSCFKNLSYEEKKLAHRNVLNRNLKYMLELSQIFEAEYLMPFAGAYVIGGSLWRKNEVLGTTTWDEAGQYLVENQSPSLPLLLREGLTFDLKEKKIVNGVYEPVDVVDQARYIEQELSQKKYAYQQDQLMSDSESVDYFTENLVKARATLWRYQDRFKFYQPIHLFIQFRDRYFHFNFANEATEIVNQVPLRSVDQDPLLICELDERLLKRIFTRKAHWNNAEIGCHIDFTRVPDVYLPDVHSMMSFFHL